ncbi:MAG: DUF2254 domain-containing protein [Pirellulaceae bacterium]
MKAILITAWATIRTSYWFIPSLMAIAAIVLSFATTAVDSRIGSEWLEKISWLYANKPAGARAVLSTVAGSMITVAGVTFSMTILSISHTTSQVGPRLVNNFMRDRGNQFTLGVFIATFLYCVMVLRTVRNADTAAAGGVSGSADLTAAFVPHVAVMVGLLLAIASVGVLIFFIHHIPETIHVSNIIAGVGRELNEKIEEQFPARVGQPNEDDSERETEANLPEDFYEDARRVGSEVIGYLEYLDSDGLMNLAKQHDLVLRLLAKPGDFRTSENTLLLASPASRVTDEVRDAIRAKFIFGAKRTPTQDLRFQINQLVEVAMRALSPGVNDPFTAMNCMDWLQSALENLSERELPDAHRYDDDHNLRMVAEATTFNSFASLVFDQLRPYVATDRNAAIHMMEMIASIAAHVSSDRHRKSLVQHASEFRELSQTMLKNEQAFKVISDRYRELIKLVDDDEYRKHITRTDDWSS